MMRSRALNCAPSFYHVGSFEKLLLPSSRLILLTELVRRKSQYSFIAPRLPHCPRARTIARFRSLRGDYVDRGSSREFILYRFHILHPHENDRDRILNTSRSCRRSAERSLQNSEFSLQLYRILSDNPACRISLIDFLRMIRGT